MKTETVRVSDVQNTRDYEMLKTMAEALSKEWTVVCNIKGIDCLFQEGLGWLEVTEEEANNAEVRLVQEQGAV